MARLVEIETSDNVRNPVMDKKNAARESGGAKLHEVAMDHQFRMDNDPYYATAYDAGFGSNALAQMGGVMKGLGYTGPRQILGIDKPGEVEKYLAEMRGSQDAPGGTTGAMAGYAASAAPAFLIPGVNTGTGAALLSGSMGAMEPVGKDGSRLRNAVVSGLGGYAGNSLGKVIGGQLKNRFDAKTLDLTAQQSRHSAINATRKSALDEGFKIPPSTVNPTFGNRVKESIAGKAAVQQSASNNNVVAVDRLARKAASIADDMPLTEDTLKEARHALAQPYRDVAALPQKNVVQARSGFTDWDSPVQAQKGFNPADALEKLKQVRAESKIQWQHYGRQKTPDAIKAARALDDTADEIENALEQYAINNGSPELVERLRVARTAIAKNHAVDSALIEGSGSIDARVLGRMRHQRKPLSGELKIIADFARNHPKLVQPDLQVGSPGVSKAVAVTSAILGGGGAIGGSVGGPVGAGVGATIGSAIPFVVPWTMQKYLMSNMAQRGLLPSYTVNPLLQAGAKTMTNPMIQGPLGMALPGLLSTYE